MKTMKEKSEVTIMNNSESIRCYSENPMKEKKVCRLKKKDYKFVLEIIKDKNPKMQILRSILNSEVNVSDSIKKMFFDIKWKIVHEEKKGDYINFNPEEKIKNKDLYVVLKSEFQYATGRYFETLNYYIMVTKNDIVVL